ncbi:MAG TPA: peptidoglycan editing factor PgeF [Myxococcales bacterium]|nr:peptidoglycan editing factor PgeF [Myxococcales bacterium]
MKTDLWRTAGRFPAHHGFSTRLGGVSEGPLSSLNLGRSAGDSPERVEENLRRACAAASLDAGDLHTVSQVHGADVHRVTSEQRHQARTSPRPRADALYTSEPGAALAVQVADCVPILLADPQGRRVAAVHSGWRGTYAEISARAVEAFTRDGSGPDALHVAIGPSIRLCCYVVGADLAEQFRERFGAEVAVEEDGRLHLDLVRAIRQTLRRAGVPDERIEVLPDCTSCERALYYSHRRDHGITGRHLAFVANDFSGPGPVS